MSHRFLVITGAVLTCLAVAVHAVVLPDVVSPHYRGYVAALLGALVAAICALVDAHYIMGLCAILVTPAIRVGATIAKAANTQTGPLVALTTPSVFADAGVSFGLSMLVCAPLLAAAAHATPKATAALGAAAHVVTAGLIAAVVLVVVLFNNQTSPAVVDMDLPSSVVSHDEGAGVQSAGVHCSVAAEASLHRLAFSIFAAAGAPILIFFALKSLACVSTSTANAYHKVATLFAILWLGVTAGNDWAAFNQRCSMRTDCALAHCSLCTVTQLLRVAIAAILLPVLFASLAGDLADDKDDEAEPSEDCGDCAGSDEMPADDDGLESAEKERFITAAVPKKTVAEFVGVHAV